MADPRHPLVPRLLARAAEAIIQTSPRRCIAGAVVPAYVCGRMSAEKKMTARSALGVLRDAPYRRYIIGSAISDTGTWMQVMAPGYVIRHLTTKTALSGWVTL